MTRIFTKLPNPIYWSYRAGFSWLYEQIVSPDRTNIYEREWDLLIILDACRPDLMEEISCEFTFLPENIETIYSVGSSSGEWMENTFIEYYEEEISKTSLLTGNVHSEEFIEENRFESVYEVWKGHWDDEIGTVPPRPVTDAVIETGRQDEGERIIAHYMQPHFPSIADPSLGPQLVERDGEWVWESTSVWNLVRRGEIELDRVWSAYRENLRIVLEDVKLLLENIKADTVVITADHGNAIGEWGYYDHPGHRSLPFLIEVPWVTTEAHDTDEHQPSIELDSFNISEDEREQRLRHLGYL